jgi:hypothetical protein
VQKTQTDLAHHCKVSKSLVSYWTKLKDLPAEKIPQILEFVGCTPEELMGNSESALHEQATEYRTNAILKMMSRAEVLERFRQNVEKWPPSGGEKELDHLKACRDILDDLQRRYDAAELERKQK